MSLIQRLDPQAEQMLVQTLLEARQAARGLAASLEGLLPFFTEPETKSRIQAICSNAWQADEELRAVYTILAPDAFKPKSERLRL